MAELVPPKLVAETVTRNVDPTSACPSASVLAVPPTIAVQAEPLALQRDH
jgi:hypothetical protein